MSGLPLALYSPLMRHPSLLVQKVKKRLGVERPFSFCPKPGAAVYSPLEDVRIRMQQWVKRATFNSTDAFPPNRIFNQDFNLQDLWRVCDSGPVPERKNLFGDIKTPWEFSRFHAVLLNALSCPEGCEDGRATEAVDFFKIWLEHNGNSNGVNWVSAMDVAIRAVNLILADACLQGRLRHVLGADEWDYWLWQHGCCIWRRLETRLICSNHYLANLMGLYVVGLAFSGSGRALQWRSFAISEWEKAIQVQTYRDGGLYEASLPYHVLVLEMMFVCMTCEPLVWSRAFIDKAKAMMQAALDMKTGDGQVWAVGDDDSGRIVPIDWITSWGRVDGLREMADILFEGYDAEPRRDVVYEVSGWWACRRDHWSVFCEFGDVGLGGLGGHAHNDSLSVCIECDNQPVFSDPGSGIYTPDPVVRNRFRSQQAHSTIMFNNEEYNPLPDTAPGMNAFFLPSKTHPSIISCRPGGMELEYRILLAETEIDWTRRIHVQEEWVSIRDQWYTHKAISADCFFVLSPAVNPVIGAEGVVLQLASSQLILTCDVEANVRIQDLDYSACYGNIGQTKKLRYTFDRATRRSVCWMLRRVTDGCKVTE